MTGVIFHDSVQLYGAASELARSYTRAGTPASGYGPALTLQGRNSGRSFKPADRRGVSHIYKTIAPRKKLGCHFSMRVPTSIATSDGFPFFVAGSSARLNVWSTGVATTGTTSSVPADLVTLSVGTGGALVFEHAVQTSTGTTVNRLVLQGSGAVLVPGTLHHLEVLADFSAATATLKVWLDGALCLDTSLNRDRLASTLPGILLDTFEYVSFGGLSATIGDAGNPHFSDVVIYDPDLRAGPIGPVSVSFFPANNAAFEAISNDATKVAIPGVDLTSFGVTGMPSAGEIVSAFISARSLPTVSDQNYNVELRASNMAGAAEFTTLTGALAGGSPIVTEVRIPGVDDFSDLVGLTLKARSR